MSMPPPALGAALCTALSCLACAGTAPAAAPPRAVRVSTPGTTAPASRETAAQPAAGEGVLFRFRLGSTVHGSPVVGADGTAYVGAGDGLLSAVSPEGTLAWSFTLEGAVAGSPVLDAEGHILVATLGGRLYSFSPRGALSWQTRLPFRPTTGLAVSSAWGVLFGAEDGSLWAYSSHASPLFHVALGTEPRATPRPSGKTTWVAGRQELVLLDGATRRLRADLGAPVQSLSGTLPDGAAVAVAGSSLVVVTAAGAVSVIRPGIAWATVAGDEIVALEPGGAGYRLGPAGTERGTFTAGVRPSDAPLVLPSGVVCVPGESGNLALVRSDAPARRIHVAGSALHSPVHDPPRARVVVVSGDGTLAAVPEGG